MVTSNKYNRASLWFLLLMCNTAITAQNAACSITDMVNSGLLQIANLKPNEFLRITKQIADSNYVYILGEINGGSLASNSLVIAAIDNNTGLPAWCKKWQFSQVSNKQANFVLNGGFIYVADYLSQPKPGILLAKIDLMGRFIWSRQFDFGNSLTNFTPASTPFIDVDDNEVLVSLKIYDNQSGLGNNKFLEAIIATVISTDGAALWAKMFGIKAECDHAFFNNTPIGLLKAAQTGEYILCSKTSGWPITTPGNPPLNSYSWVMTTKFSANELQNQYTGNYYLPNITGPANLGHCLGFGTASFIKLTSGGFMLCNNINGLVSGNKEGFFFVTFNEQINVENAIIAHSKSYPCSSSPAILPSGKILLGSPGFLEDSFTVASIFKNNILFEKKYPKYKHPMGRFNSIHLSAIEMPGSEKLFIFLRNDLLQNEPYTEVFNDNIYIDKPQCKPNDKSETKVSPVGVYSHAIKWDTIAPLKLVGYNLYITEEPAILSYQTNAVLNVFRISNSC